MHIVFNMYLLREFGSQIESLKGPKFFLTFVLLLALFSNMTQFFVSGPAFGGMSGVNYGLFGYVWIKDRYDPGDGFRIDSTLALWLFGWLALGFVGELTGVLDTLPIGLTQEALLLDWRGGMVLPIVGIEAKCKSSLFF